MHPKYKMFLIAMLAITLAVGCASSNKKFVEVSYNSLETLTISGNAAITSIEDLWKQGVINDNTARQALAAYTKYYAVQQTLVVSLAEFTAIDDKAILEQRKIEIRDGLSMMIQLSGEIIDLLQAFGALPTPVVADEVKMIWDK